MRKYFLGIDTSNYTTSVSLCDEYGTVVANVKKLLPVAEGQKGLRQSDALFHHTVQLPEIIAEVREKFSPDEILAVGASVRPRDAEGSYMPCFLAGRSAAAAASMAAGCRLFEFSHQCGHVCAALYSSGRLDLINRNFIAFHVSGGTTDVLYVTPDRDHVFAVERIGGTLDLNAGQVIDRAGVMMGLVFPCGPELERLALSYDGEEDNPSVSLKGLSCNLSGIENKASQLYSETGDRERCAAFVLSCVTETMAKLTAGVEKKYPCVPIIYAGGVMSCSVIRNRLSSHGDFADPAFSSDNAAGIALMTRMKYYGLF